MLTRTNSSSLAAVTRTGMGRVRLDPGQAAWHCSSNSSRRKVRKYLQADEMTSRVRMTSCKPADGMDMCIDYKQWSLANPQPCVLRLTAHCCSTCFMVR